MYLLVKSGLPLGHQVNCVAHAAIKCYLEYQDHPETQEWLENSFRKVTCEVTPEQFEIAKKYDDWIVFEEKDIGGEEVVLAFRPRKEWSQRFSSFRLFGSDMKKRISA